MKSLSMRNLLSAAALVRPLAHPARMQRLVCSAGSSPIADALDTIRGKVKDAASAAGREGTPRLVAVSKTKPVELLREAYDAGQREFGENYVQELIDKAPLMPEDVAWRFIGKVQSNKAKPLVQGVPNLAVVETVETTKLADRLQKAMAGLEAPRAAPLGVMIQVNTSPWEGSKGGVLAEDVLALAQHIAKACPDLKLVGLMTIGGAARAAPYPCPALGARSMRIVVLTLRSHPCSRVAQPLARWPASTRL